MKKILLALGFLFVLLSAAPQMVAAHDSYNDSYVIITITDAYYAELDYDSLENDIVVFLRIQKSSSYLNFWLYMEIELPRGKVYRSYFFIEAYDKSLNIKVIAHNIATESGWYEVRAYLSTYNPWSGWRLELHDTLVFDPPGKAGSDPCWAMVICG